MSFRLFVYYCALCGGWAAFLGWLLGALLAPGRADQPTLGRNGIIAMFLGLMIAMGIGLVDALWVLSWKRLALVFLRVGVAVIIGAVGGLLGGIIAHLLYDFTQVNLVGIVGWTILGLLCGVSIGTFDMLSSIVRQQDQKGANAKLLKSLIGGTIGGVLGGTLRVVFKTSLSSMFSKDPESLYLPTALGFVALGACIGLLIGLAQVILKEAWVKVEAGFRAGREMILAKEKTTVGRAEGTDIALFGDAGVEKLHALIVQDAGRYFLEDNTTPGGTYVNEQRVNGRAPLQSGDLIRLGKSVLRFYEKQKRK